MLGKIPVKPKNKTLGHFFTFILLQLYAKKKKY